MPDIEIVKLKLRRGTDAQRQTVKLEQGELGYTTDAKRVWVGDGFTDGGNVVGNVAHPPMYVGTRTDLTEATTGDIVYEDNLLWQLSGTDATAVADWVFIGDRLDGYTLTRNTDNTVKISENGVGITEIDSSIADLSGGLMWGTGGLSARIDNSSITINANGELETTHVNISAGDVGLGLSGGDGDPLGVFVTDSFTFDGDRLEFANAPSETVPAEAIKSSTIGTGITNSGGTLQLETIGANIMYPFSITTTDNKGRVNSTSNSIEQNLSGTDAGSGFFGSLDAAAPGSETSVDVLSGNGAGDAVTIQLSSAGFIQIASGTDGNFAIPVFKF